VPRAQAGTVVIDNFDNPTAPDVYYTTGAPGFSTLSGETNHRQAAGIVGGERELTLDVNGLPTPISAAALVGFDPVLALGILQIATAGPAGTLVTLSYDGIIPASPLLADLTDGGLNGEFVLRFLNVDSGSGHPGLRVSVTVSDGLISTAMKEILVPDSTLPQEAVLKFSEFSLVGTSPFSNAARVDVVLNQGKTPNADFKLDFIATRAVIPEPSTWLLLVLGCGTAGICRWRRSRRS
jgi:hypothetical protein